MTEPLLSAADVARRLGVTAATVRRWALAGTFPSVRLPSGRLKFRTADVDRYDQHATPSPASTRN